MKKRILSMLFAAVMTVGLVSGMTLTASAAESKSLLQSDTTISLTATVQSPIYIDGVGGNDNNDGLTTQAPVKTLTKAIELAGENGTIIVMTTANITPDIMGSGNVTLEDLTIERWAENDTKNLLLIQGDSETSTMTVTLKNITIDGKDVSTTGTYLALIQVNDYGGLVIEDGAKLTNQNGIAVYITKNTAKASMTGGEISGNATIEGSPACPGVYVSNGTFEMSGGLITDNSNTFFFGGGVYVNYGTFLMSGGTITENHAHSGGGGVAVNEGKFTMSGGKITSNVADCNNIAGHGSETTYGGGVYAYDLYGSNTSELDILISGGEISSNTANFGKAMSVMSKSTNTSVSVSGSPKIVEEVDVGPSGANPVKVTGAFTPVGKVTLNLWGASAGSTIAVYNEGLAANANAFACYTSGKSTAVNGQNIILKDSYAVTVENGIGDDYYTEGATVTIEADTPAAGKKFAGWTSEDGVTFADASAAETTFTMPAKAVTVIANYKDIEYVTLNLESPRGLKDTITIDVESTVADLKAAVAEKCNVTFGGESEYRLFGEDLSYPNSKLDDDTKVLKDIGVASNQTIHLEKSTNWDASSEPIKIFGLTITGGKGSQEPYGDYTNVDYYWNYYYKTITIKSTAGITISGTGEPNTNIIIKKPSGGGYTNLTISDLSLTTDAGACINVQSNSWVKLTVKGNNTLTATGAAAQYTVDKMPALTLTNSGAYLKIMSASTGTLTATTNIVGQPGIGTYDNTSSVWGVEINGGTIIANGGAGAAGIRAQAVCIYGGDVTANGGIDGYGSNNLYPYSIEILGGTVTASSKDGKALTAVPNLDSYQYYTATASTNKNGTDAVIYDSAANDTYKYFKIVPRDVYTVKFNANGGEGTMADQIVDTGVETALAENQFTRKGYTFAGWAATADGTVVYADKGNVKNIAATGNSTTLYAKWTANTYTVKFDANGGSGTMTDQSFTYDVSQNLSANAFAYANKHFNGWDTAADGTGTAYAAGQSVSNLTAEANGEVTLYAQWSDKTPQTVTFDTSARSAAYGDGTLEAWTATAAGAITYSSSDETVATVDGTGAVTVLKAGTTTITASAAETAEYAANSASYTLTIAPKDITGAAVDSFDTMTYTGTAQTPAAVVTLDGFGEIEGTWSDVTNVGETSTFTPASGNFGTLSRDPGMEKAWLTVTADTKYIEVDEDIPEPTYTITGFVGTDTAYAVTGAPVLSYGGNPDTAETGTYFIEIAEGTLTATNYHFNLIPGELYVLEHVHGFTGVVSLGTTNSENDTIIVACSAVDCPDEGAVKIILIAPENAIYEPGLWHTVSLYGDTMIDLDSEDIVYSATPVDAGTYTASVTYDGKTASVTYTVAKRTLTVTADNKSATVGDAEPTYTYTVTGWGENHDEEDEFAPRLTGLTAVCTGVDMTRAGSCAITLSGTPAVMYYDFEMDANCDITANYDIVTVPGTLTVREVPAPTYKVTVEDAEGGAVKANRTYAYYGSTVTLTVTPEEGCELDSLAVTDSRGNEIALTDKGDGKYTFQMPYRNVTVTAVFHRCPSTGLTDVDRSQWYHEAIDYVLEKGLVDTADETAFDRTSPATRAVLVEAIWRNEGCPVVDYLMTYSDVEQEHEYAEAIRWASSVGIVNGFPDGGFHPDEAITREQLATLFYRYEQYKGEGFEGEWEYELTYADAERISTWAYEAVCWNTMKGIIQGDGTNFDPRGTATRAHVAQLLMNYLERDK